MFTFGLTRGDAGGGGRTAGNGRTLGKGRGSGGRGARDDWGRGRNLLGADELVFQDVSTGDIVQAEVADDRSDATWKAVVDARLTALGTEGLYLGSDRAKALIQLAEKGLEGLSMPDFFHVIHELVKSYSLAIGRCVRHAHQERRKPRKRWHASNDQAHAAPNRPAATAEVEAKRAEVRRWEAVQCTYRHQWETLSLSRHPFCIADSAPQTSTQVESHPQAAVEATKH